MMLGPTVKDGEHLFGVTHVFGSFNDTFINSSTLFHQSQMKYAIVRTEEQSPLIMFLRLWRLLGFLGAKSSSPLLILWKMRSSLKWFASKAKQILKRKLFYPGTSTSYRVEYFGEREQEPKNKGECVTRLEKVIEEKSKIIDLLQEERGGEGEGACGDAYVRADELEKQFEKLNEEINA